MASSVELQQQRLAQLKAALTKIQSGEDIQLIGKNGAMPEARFFGMAGSFQFDQTGKPVVSGDQRVLKQAQRMLAGGGNMRSDKRNAWQREMDYYTTANNVLDVYASGSRHDTAYKNAVQSTGSQPMKWGEFLTSTQKNVKVKDPMNPGKYIVGAEVFDLMPDTMGIDMLSTLDKGYSDYLKNFSSGQTTSFANSANTQPADTTSTANTTAAQTSSAAASNAVQSGESFVAQRRRGWGSSGIQGV